MAKNVGLPVTEPLVNEGLGTETSFMQKHLKRSQDQLITEDSCPIRFIVIESTVHSLFYDYTQSFLP